MDKLVTPISISKIYEFQETGETWIILEWKRGNGEPEQVRVPFGDLSEPRKLRRTMMNKGCLVPTDHKEWCSAVDELHAAAALCLKKRRNVIPVTGLVGWSGDFDAFVLPEKTIGCSPVFMAQNLENFIEARSAGTYKGWKSEVAKPALLSSRLMLLLSAAFVAPLLKLMGWPSFGINLSGPSSIGKSSALRGFWSTIGGGQLRPHGATKRGAEQLARGHCDLILPLDETAVLRPNDRSVGLRQLTYQFNSARSDSVDRNSRAGNGEKGEEWRLIWASTSEDRIYEGRRKDGEHVRLIDVPPPAKSLSGLIDRQPYFHFGKGKARAKARDAIDLINRGAATHYGHALPAFIAYIMEEPETVQQTCQSYFDDFRSQHSEEAKTPLQSRLLDEFACCYAAARLAIDAKVLPWKKQSLQNAIGHCWVDTLNAIPDAEREISDRAHKVLEFVLYEADLVHRDGAPRQQDFGRLDGVRIEHGRGEVASVLIPYKRLRRNFAGEPLLNESLSFLKLKGILRAENGRKVYTDLIKHSDGSKKRYYHFDVARAEAFHNLKEFGPVYNT